MSERVGVVLFNLGGPDTLEVEQVGPDEIVFPNCREMPSPLRRCGSPNR